MPDYSWHLPQRCGAADTAEVSTSVLSSCGKHSYTVWVRGTSAECSCPGWRFHRKCKHVEAVRATQCRWTLGTGPHQTLQKNVSCRCPACGGPTELVA